MLVLPLLSILAAVAHVHASVHDSHVRRSQSMRQARDARYKARADAARDFLPPADNPFSTPDSSTSASQSSTDSGSTDSSSSTSDSGSQSITLPPATSTDVNAASTTTTSDSGSVTTTASSDSGSVTTTTTDSGTSTDSGSASNTITSAPTSPTDSGTTTTTTSDSASSASTTDIISALSSILSGILDGTSTTTTDTSVFNSTTTFSASQTITNGPTTTDTSTDNSTSTTTSDTLSIPFSVSVPTSLTVSATDTDNSTTSTSDTGDSGPTSVSSTTTTTTDDPPPSSSSTTDTGFPTSSSSSGFISSSTSDTGVVTTTASSVASVNSDLTFILTESSLALASVATTTSMSLSDPDAPTTTVSLTAAAQTALETAALPSGLPSVILPPTGAIQNPGANWSYVSLLFDGYLDWQFVCTNPISSTQIFAIMPVILATALGVSTDQIKTASLEVRIPDTYHNVSDVDQLQTLFLVWILSADVDELALQLKSRNSAFYTGLSDNPLATQLASHIVSAFPLNSVAAPGTDGSSSGSGQSANDITGASSQSKTRQDAIIGVVTALGAIAVLVLIFLAYRAFQRRAELAHHRLSDAPDMAAGIPPPNRDFDQDSVGGQRRRSFYFAEDSLRGFGGEESYSYTDARPAPGAPGMSQRRNVMPAAISAPILQQSSMNW